MQPVICKLPGNHKVKSVNTQIWRERYQNTAVQKTIKLGGKRRRKETSRLQNVQKIIDKIEICTYI